MEFGPNDSKVVLKPRLGYVPKVLSTPFRVQVIALPPSTGSQELSLLFPVRSLRVYLRVYIELFASYRESEQLFFGFGNHAKGGPVTKQGISMWLVDCYYPSILLLEFAVPHRSQSPFQQRHHLFLGMVQRGVHFGNW